MLQNKWKIIVPIVILMVLAISFWYGEDLPNTKDVNNINQSNQIDINMDDNHNEELSENQDVQEKNNSKETIESKGDLPVQGNNKLALEEDNNTEGKSQKTQEIKETQGTQALEQINEPEEQINEPEEVEEIEKAQEAEKIQTTETKQSEDLITSPPVETTNTEVRNQQLKCTLIIRCDTILNNMDRLNAEKHDLVADDGIIFSKEDIVFYEGESVFNVLLREMKINKIHMEYADTPLYNSAYIEGIGNIYEFDCGELSGWMYKVNDWFPNYGCSRYMLSDGDTIEFLYTCDLGKDIGGGMSIIEQYQ